MRGEAYKICAACEARNRARWEFCVRCGESLHEIEAIQPEGAEGLTVGPVTISPGMAVGGIVGAIAIVVGAWVFVPQMEPQGPDPANFPPLGTPTPRPDGFPSWPPPGDIAKREGRALLLEGKPEEALAQLRQAAAEAPEDAQVRNLLAHALWQQGDQEAALAEFRIATQLTGERTTGPQHDLARALSLAGRGDEAIQAYEHLATEEESRRPSTLKELGRLYLEGGRNREAADALDRATRLAPRNADLQEQLGFILEQSGRSEEAVSAYQRAAELAPADGGKVIRLADVMVQQGRAEEGVQVLQQGVERNPEQPMLRQRLGIVLEKAGRPAEAVAAYREYLRLAPDAPDAAKVAQRAEALAKKRGGSS